MIVRGRFKAIEAPEKVVYHNSYWLHVMLNKFVCRVAYEFLRYLLCMLKHPSASSTIYVIFHYQSTFMHYAIFLFLLVQSLCDDKRSYKPVSRL